MLDFICRLSFFGVSNVGTFDHILLCFDEREREREGLISTDRKTCDCDRRRWRNTKRIVIY